MYLFYEHTRDASGKVVVTDVTTSSYESGKGISWSTDRPVHEFLLLMFKKIPIAYRTFNPDTKVWSFIGGQGEVLLKQIEAAALGAGLSSKIKFEEIPELATQMEAGGIDRSKKKQFNPEDFYYNKNAPVATKTLSKEEVKKKLLVLFDCGVEPLDAVEWKKLYRKAALKYHPDRNGGDASKMSELNMLWGVFNG